MMRFGLLASCALLTLAGFSTGAQAAEIEVKSENVVFVGDVPQEAGERLVRNLEIYRDTIIALVGLKGKPDNEKLRVYGAKNTKALKKYTGRGGAAGVYTNGADGPVFVTITKGGFEQGRWSSQVALHEYGHHILHGMSRDTYPRWYDEGFANYLSTFKIEGDLITIGAPNAQHGLSLREDRWMDPEVVLSSIHNYPRTRRISQFYGQSWLYVHYLQNTPELGRKLPAYLEALKTGQKPLAAFEAAYEMTAKEFHRKARNYWNADAFPVMQFKASEKLLNPKLSVRTLSTDEAKLAYAGGQLTFISKKNAKDLKTTYAELSETMGETEEILMGQGHSAMILQDFEAASGFASKAMAKAPTNTKARSLYADVEYHKFSEPAFDAVGKGDAVYFPTNDAAKAVGDELEKALAMDPVDRTAMRHLINLYGRSQLPLTPTVRKTAETYSKYYLTPRSVGEYLDLASIFIRDSQTLRGCMLLNRAQHRVEGYDDKKSNDDYARAEAMDAAHPECF